MIALRGGEKKESKKTIVQEQLKELIQSNSFKEGEKLPSERELAQMLGVSRNVLREAVISLSGDGILEVRERQGIFVRSLREYGMLDSLQGLQILPADFVSYQLEVRTIISVPAARLAAQRRTDADLAKLRECYAQFVACPYGTPEEKLQNGKWEALLHHLVTEAAHNPVLSRLNESINSLVERNNTLVHPNLLDEAGWVEKLQKDHAAIIQAVEEKDSKRAGDILQRHMIDSVEVLMEKYPDKIKAIPSPYWSMI